MQDNPIDLSHLIRSVQRLEGNPDCFQTAKEHCDQKGCVWRVYCLEKPLFVKGIKDEGQGGKKSSTRMDPAPAFVRDYAPQPSRR